MTDDVGNNDGTINHHTQSKYHPREGYNVQRLIEQVEEDKCSDERCHHAQTNNHGRLHIAQKEQCHKEYQQEAQTEILLQVGNGVIQ